MGFARKLLIGASVLAVSGGLASAAARKTVALTCAKPAEFAAMQVAAAQQELMVAALTCGDAARADYNAFQTGFNTDLRKSDKTMLTMFRRLMGARKGDAAYNLFKTDLASRAESRRIHHAPNYCAAASHKAKLALAPQPPVLEEYAAEAAVADFDWPIESCLVVEARLILHDVMPRPNPLRVAEAAIAPPLEVPTAVVPSDAPAAAALTPDASAASPANPEPPKPDAATP